MFRIYNHLPIKLFSPHSATYIIRFCICSVEIVIAIGGMLDPVIIAKGWMDRHIGYILLL